MICVRFQGKPLNITVIQVYGPSSNAEEAEVEQFYEDLQDLLELTPKKRCSFHYRGLECKSRKSRNTWSNRQIWVLECRMKQGKGNRVLPRKCTGHSKYPLPTTQEKTLHVDQMVHYQMVNNKIRVIIFFAAKDEVLYNQQKQDWELTVAQTMNSYCHIQT